MSIWSTISKWLVKVFWPWFVKHVWPFIKEHVLELIVFFLVTVKNKIKEYVSKRSEKREIEAAERAEDAEKRAKSADSEPEKEKWEAIAGVWREVANTIREENEALKKRVEELIAETTTDAKDALDTMALSAEFSGDQTLLTIGDQTHKLPSPKTEIPEDDKNANKSLE